MQLLHHSHINFYGIHTKHFTLCKIKEVTLHENFRICLLIQDKTFLALKLCTHSYIKWAGIVQSVYQHTTG